MSAGINVEVSARRFAVPYECPCCGAVPDTELVIPLTPSKDRPASPETAHALGFPYCKTCIAHVARWDSVKNVETGIKVLGVLAGIGLGIGVHWAAGIGAFVAAVVLSIVVGRASRAKAKAECRESCAGPGLAVHYLGWSGNSSAFVFESAVYAARFAEQNTSKLANVDPVLRKVIEGHKLARLQVPTPAAAVRAVPAAATVSEWIDRIQTAGGRVARLDWLVRSLDAFSGDADRRAIIDATAKLELAGLADKLDQMSGEARARHVQKAIIDTRADNIPEELRDEVVRQLEARLSR
jgi:hypothetical protein